MTRTPHKQQGTYLNMTDTEKRRDCRFSLKRRVKVMCPTTGRCWAGQTEDYSAGGVKLTIDEPWHMAPGQPLRVGIDWTGRQGLFHSNKMPRATVVRTVALAGRQHLAVAFDQRQELAA